MSANIDIIEALETAQQLAMGGAEVILVAHHRFSNTSITCRGCSTFGTLIWDRHHWRYGKATPFVGVSGDFRVEHDGLRGAEYQIVCTNCQTTRALESSDAGL
jgi:hypothetical protein